MGGISPVNKEVKVKKKLLVTLSLVLVIAVTIISFTIPAYSVVAGTCCNDYISTCVIGPHVLEHKFYQESGPCPPEIP